MPGNSQTKAQWGAPILGLGAYGSMYPMTSEQGVTLLPIHAAQLGSGTHEGRNPYSHICHQTHMANGVAAGIGFSSGYPIPLPGTYATYRMMLRHPTIALGTMIKTAPIIAGRCGYEKVSNAAPADAPELIQSVFEPVRTQLFIDFVRGLWMGNADIEPVWGTNRDGAIVPTKFKALLQDITTYQIDPSGELAWINNTGAQLMRPHFIHFDWGREGSNWYGCSRLENCRRIWANWLSDEDQLHRLNQKAAGILGDIGFPPDWEVPDDENESNYIRAIRMAQAMASGRWTVHENLTGISADDISRAPELADKSLFKITLHDMGNTGPSQSALIESLKYKDALLARGILAPERSLIEASQSGSRADSETHNSLNDADIDTIHSMICQAINEQCVDEILLQNYGPEAVGTVRIKPKEIIDENRLVDDKLLDAALKNPAMLQSIFESMDVDAWAKRNNIQLKEGSKIEVDGLDTNAESDEERLDSDAKEELSRALNVKWSEKYVA